MDKLNILEKHIAFKKTSVKAVEKLKDIRRYLNMYLISSKKPLSKFNEDDIIKFLNRLNYSVRTTNDIKTYIKVFIKWYYPDWSSRFRNLDKICKLQTPSRAYEPEELVTFEEVEKLVSGEKDLMWKAYWLTFFYGGFRPSECANLTWDKILFENEGVIIKLHATKTKKDFYKSLPKNAEHLLKEWRKYNHSNYVFPSPIKNDSPIQARTICRKLKRLSRRVLGKEVVPYALRHSIATILYKDDNRKDDDTANQLGHKKSMKEVYKHMNGDDLKTQARKIWIKTKPITKGEIDRLKELEKKNKLYEKQLKILSKGLREISQMKDMFNQK